MKNNKKNMDLKHRILPNNQFKTHFLGKGSKIKSIIFAEFSAKGYPPAPLPPSRKIINFSPTFWMSGWGEGGDHAARQ